MNLDWVSQLIRREKKECPVCGYKGKFDQLSKRWRNPIFIHGKKYHSADFETVDVQNWSCSNCRADTKTRLQKIFIDHEIASDRPVKILHIAPENNLRNDILRNKHPQTEYISCDLIRNDVDFQLDLRDLSIIQDSSIDLVLCSHVLEHIPEEYEKALSELFRVLSATGVALVMVPTLSSTLDNYEDSWINTDELRLKHYGLDDHYRFFTSHGLIKDLISSGFDAERLNVESITPHFNKYGIPKESYLYLGRKPS